MRILHIIPYQSLYPPKNGGQLRCFHLMDELSKYYKVDVISFQSPEAIKGEGYQNKNISFYSTISFKRKKGIIDFLPLKLGNAIRHRILVQSIQGPASSVVLEFSHIIKNLASRYSYSYIIMEHLSSMQLAPLFEKWMPNVPRIFDAHNVDHLLIAPKSSYFNIIKNKESTIYRYANLFLACSEQDVSKLENLNKKKINGIVVPNGVAAFSKPFVRNKKETYNHILFCGSLDYKPNKIGILWFYKRVWPKIISKIPYLKLIIIGKGSHKGYEDLISNDSVEFIGEVEDVAPFYKDSYIAVAPLLEGSGTRLKILEAMSFGNPVVSTSKGIEGIDFKKEVHALVADDEDSFSAQILYILANIEKGEVMRRNARKLIENNYSWETIGSNLKKNLESILQKLIVS